MAAPTLPLRRAARRRRWRWRPGVWARRRRALGLACTVLAATAVTWAYLAAWILAFGR